MHVMTSFWVMSFSADEEWTDDDIRSAWPSERCEVKAYLLRDAIEAVAGRRGMENEDERIFVVATTKDGADAKRYSVSCEISISYYIGNGDVVSI